jgi:hypothetical protein
MKLSRVLRCMRFADEYTHPKRLPADRAAVLKIEWLSTKTSSITAPGQPSPSWAAAVPENVATAATAAATCLRVVDWGCRGLGTITEACVGEVESRWGQREPTGKQRLTPVRAGQ